MTKELSLALDILKAAQSKSPYIIPSVNKRIVVATLRSAAKQLVEIPVNDACLKNRNDKLIYELALNECALHLQSIAIELANYEQP
jgi:hypothetical protein